MEWIKVKTVKLSEEICINPNSAANNMKHVCSGWVWVILKSGLSDGPTVLTNLSRIAFQRMRLHKFVIKMAKNIRI